jgi:hypothetical protein
MFGQEASMLGQTMVLAVGLIFCLIGFVSVFAAKDGQGPSNITGRSKRRLLALWILCAIDLLILAFWHLIKVGFIWSAEMSPIAIGLGLTAIGLIQLNRITATATEPGIVVMTSVARSAMLALFIGVSGCLIYILVQLSCHMRGPEMILGTTSLIVAVGITLTSIIYFFVKDKPDSLADDGDPMPIVTRRVLALYLIAIGIVLGSLLWRIGSIDFSDAGLDIRTEPLAHALQNETASTVHSGSEGGGITNSPVLYKLFAQTSLSAIPVVSVTAYGDHFTADSKVRLNQQEQPTVFIDANRLQAQLDQASVNGLDPILVDVTTNKQLTSAIALKIARAHIRETILGYSVDLTRERQLLLLAMLAGALGSFIHSLKSFGDFVGNRTLTASWFWWYITRPFLGAALAVVFYAVLRGGFMAGTAADAKAVNQFGVVAVGALVGMFADRASDKLADIFDTLFKGADNRTGKLAAPIIDRLDPSSIAKNTNPPSTLRILGDRLGAITQVKFDSVVHAHGAVSEKEITVPLTSQDVAAQHTFKVSVVGDNGESPTKDLQIT